MAAPGKTGLRLVGDWGRLQTMIGTNASFGRELHREMRRALQLNAKELERDIALAIQQKKYAPNAPMTVAIKASATPLVDYGQLFKSITSKMVGQKMAFVGVLKNARDRKGKKLAPLALLLHEGGLIPVTKKMITMFEKIHLVCTGDLEPGFLYGRAEEIWKRLDKNDEIIWPLSDNRKFIQIPKRQFIKDVVERRETINRCRSRWYDAIYRAARTTRGK